MFDAVLIANRGEIACRIIRTLKRLGIRAIAVYSDADRAPCMAQADEAIWIGPAPASESYLRADAILEAAAHAGAQASIQATASSPRTPPSPGPAATPA